MCSPTNMVLDPKAWGQLYNCFQVDSSPAMSFVSLNKNMEAGCREQFMVIM